MSAAIGEALPADVARLCEHEGDEAAARLLHDLVATPSVSGSEARAARLLTERMAAMGYRASIDDAGNAVGEIGDADPGAPEIVLLGHIDTVPGDIPVRFEGGTLWGRGAVDAKGPLAAFAAAGARADLPDGVRLVVIGAVGEETPDSPGASFVRDVRRPRACIIGEPSAWDRYTVGYKGRLLVEATFERDCGHSAGPGETAPEAAADWWQAVRADALALRSGDGPLFDTVQVALQRIGSSSDGLTDRAVALAGFRLPVGVEPDEVEARIRGLEVSRDATLRFYGAVPAVRTGRTGQVAQALAAAIAGEGGRPRAVVKTGTSDMNTVARAWGYPIAAYGPGDSAMDHTPHERIDVAEYLRSVRVLARAIGVLAQRVGP